MLSILTVNIWAAARARAGDMLAWLAARTEDVFVLTETSGGAGTTWLLDRLRRAGHEVVHVPDPSGDRGTALISRVRVAGRVAGLADTTIPGRVAAAVLDTDPEVALIGVYVPSRDRSAGKTEKKESFVTSLLAAIDGLPQDVRDRLILGGDYNVIARTHQPLHAGFLPFEFGLLEQLEAHGLVDAHQRCTPNERAYSWIGRTGDGYRYDYFHIGRALAERLRTCSYLHETRERKLTDHAAVTLSLAVDVGQRRETRDPSADDALMLF